MTLDETLAEIEAVAALREKCSGDDTVARIVAALRLALKQRDEWVNESGQYAPGPDDEENLAIAAILRGEKPA